ncbi:MAG TPA: endonuclease domain-containing protein [Caulobacteraceae bacterium]|nr:endonuclease domain-containing protein [Caulobacteraceae bacterium]
MGVRGIFDRTRHASGAVKRGRRLRREMTVPERKLWAALRKLDLPVRRQAPIGRYIIDFAIHSASLVIEVDGGRHDLPEAQLHDAVRDAWLRSQGYQILRFRNEQALNDPDGVVQMILNTLPPRWGKGRDGGGHAGDSGKALEATPPLAPNHQTDCPHPLPCPSPIEGEGAPNSETPARRGRGA